MCRLCLLTAAVSVGTDHRPFWCFLTDAPCFWPHRRLHDHDEQRFQHRGERPAPGVRRQPMRSGRERVTQLGRAAADRPSRGGSEAP